MTAGRLLLDTHVMLWALRSPDVLGADLVARPLPITDEHTAGVAELPMHHRDPFD